MSVEDARRQAALVAQARALGLEPWQLEAMLAVDDGLMGDIRSDARRSPAAKPSPMIPEPAAPPVPKGTGWIEPKALGPVPGLALMDAMMDVQDAKDTKALLAEEEPEPEEVRIAPHERRKRRV